MIVLIGWLCTAGILGAYAVSRGRRGPRVFDWANVLFCVPLAVTEILTGATFAAGLSMAFGGIAAVALVRS